MTARNLLFVGALAASVVGCSVGRVDTATEGFYLEGQVVNGLTGEKLPASAYTALARADGRNIKPTVDKDTGIWRIGPVKGGSDVYVTVKADGFRPWSTLVNSGVIGALGSETPSRVKSGNTAVSFVTGFAFPTTAQSPATKLSFFLADSTARPTGKVRLTPSSTATTRGRSTFDVQSKVSASGFGTFLVNLEDRLAPSAVLDITNGETTVKAGDLVLGVAYDVSVFGVDGYQASATTSSFTAGSDGQVLITLARLNNEDLLLVSKTTDETATAAADGTLSTADGKLVLTFNKDVELDTSATSLAAYKETLDGNISVSGATGGTLATNTTTALEFLSDLSVTGPTITIVWKGSAIYTAAPTKTPRSVTYGSLSSLRVRAAGTAKSGVALTNIDRIDGGPYTSSVANSETVQVRSRAADE